MMLSRWPWWWAPVLAFGCTLTVPAQSLEAPALAKLIAAARVMPGVCGVLKSSSDALTMRTPWLRQSIWPAASVIAASSTPSSLVPDLASRPATSIPSVAHFAAGSRAGSGAREGDGELRIRAERLLDAQRLVPLGHALGAGERADL